MGYAVSCVGGAPWMSARVQPAHVCVGCVRRGQPWLDTAWVRGRRRPACAGPGPRHLCGPAPLADLATAGATLVFGASRTGVWAELWLDGLVRPHQAARGCVERRRAGRESVAWCSACSHPAQPSTPTCSLCVGSADACASSSSAGASGSVLALCRDVRRTPHDGLVYLSNCLFSDPEDLARGSQAGDRCVSRPDLAGIKLS